MSEFKRPTIDAHATGPNMAASRDIPLPYGAHNDAAPSLGFPTVELPTVIVDRLSRERQPVVDPVSRLLEIAGKERTKMNIPGTTGMSRRAALDRALRTEPGPQETYSFTQPLELVAPELADKRRMQGVPARIDPEQLWQVVSAVALEEVPPPRGAGDEVEEPTPAFKRTSAIRTEVTTRTANGFGPAAHYEGAIALLETMWEQRELKEQPQPAEYVVFEPAPQEKAA